MSSLSIVTTAVVSFIVTALIGKFLIPFLHRIHFGQPINDIGPTWHQKKKGTPTMGGFMFIVGILAGVGAGWAVLSSQGVDLYNPLERINNTRLLMGIIMALAFGFLGFVDDYIKVIKKHNQGLTERQKMVMQIFIACIYLLACYISGDRSTVLVIPFVNWYLDLGLLYYPVAVFIIVGAVNAVNLTDGLDGLCGSVTFVASLGVMVIASLLSLQGIGLLATATAAGCLGFLVWNFYPAKVFMGDTGSLFLGGMVVAMAFGLGQPIFLVLVGIIYMCETLSVILQVISVKTRGKRLFKMSPIHHHFEMCGYSEVKIVALFSAVTAVGCLLAIWATTML